MDCRPHYQQMQHPFAFHRKPVIMIDRKVVIFTHRGTRYAPHRNRFCTGKKERHEPIKKRLICQAKRPVKGFVTETSHVTICDAGLWSSDQLIKKSGDIILLEEIIVRKDEKIRCCDAPHETLYIFGPAENLGIDDYFNPVIP